MSAIESWMRSDFDGLTMALATGSPETLPGLLSTSSGLEEGLSANFPTEIGGAAGSSVAIDPSSKMFSFCPAVRISLMVLARIGTVGTVIDETSLELQDGKLLLRILPSTSVRGWTQNGFCKWMKGIPDWIRGLTGSAICLSAGPCFINPASCGRYAKFLCPFLSPLLAIFGSNCSGSSRSTSSSSSSSVKPKLANCGCRWRLARWAAAHFHLRTSSSKRRSSGPLFISAAASVNIGDDDQKRGHKRRH